MVLLVSLVPWIILGVCIFVGVKWKTFWVIPIYLAMVMLYIKIQPSYLPKGDIVRTSVPALEKSSVEIEDRNRKPVDSETRNAERENKYKEGLSFISK